MYASSKEIKIRMKSIFQSQRFLIRYVSRDKEDRSDVGKRTLKYKYKVQVLFSLVKLKYYLIIIQGINSNKMFYHSKSSKLTLKSLTLRHKDFFPDSKTINHIKLWLDLVILYAVRLKIYVLIYKSFRVLLEQLASYYSKRRKTSFEIRIACIVWFTSWTRKIGTRSIAPSYRFIAVCYTIYPVPIVIFR